MGHAHHNPRLRPPFVSNAALRRWGRRVAALLAPPFVPPPSTLNMMMSLRCCVLFARAGMPLSVVIAQDAMAGHDKDN